MSLYLLLPRKGEGEDKGESGSDDDEVKLKKLKIMSIESMI